MRFVQTFIIEKSLTNLFFFYLIILINSDIFVTVSKFQIQETILKHYNTIKSCIVMVRKVDEQDSLVAYFTSDVTISIDNLRYVLESILPPSFVPQYFFQLDNFPLNSNGKVDKNKLPLPEKFIFSLLFCN